MADVEAWLAPLEGESPSGVELNHDPDFTALERLLDPARALSRDADLNPVFSTSQLVDWRRVEEEAEALGKRGRDLRLLNILLRARFANDGLDGLAEGLSIVTGCVETYWDSLFPPLRDRPAMAQAATARLNVLRDLQNRDNGLLTDIEGHGFIALPGGGITGGDLRRMNMNRAELLSAFGGGLSPADEEQLVAAHAKRRERTRAMAGGWAAEHTQAAAALAGGARASRDALAALEAAVSARIEAPFGLPDLSACLARMADALAGLDTAQAATPPDDAVTKVTAAPEAPATVARPAAAAGGSGLPGRIDSRAEAEKCLDLVIEFYRRTEPSSPIPLIAERVRRMVPMDFLELMNEVAPSGMKEFKTVAGLPDTKGK